MGLGTISRWDLGPLVGGTWVPTLIGGTWGPLVRGTWGPLLCGTLGPFICGTWGPFVIGGTQGPLISIGETWLLLLALQVVYNNCEILMQFLALL